MNLLKKLLAGVGLAAVAFAPLSAIAQTAGSFTSLHKWTDTATSKTYVYVPGQTVATPVAEFSTPRTAAPRILTLDNCGWGKFTKSTTSPPVSITGADWAGKTTGTAPTCTLAAGVYTSSNPAATGTVLDTGTQIWVRGGTGIGSATITITSAAKITSKANACGFVRVAASASRPLTTFTIGATNYDLSTVPSVPAPMICKKNGTTFTTYVPAQ